MKNLISLIFILVLSLNLNAQEKNPKLANAQITKAGKNLKNASIFLVLSTAMTATGIVILNSNDDVDPNVPYITSGGSALFGLLGIIQLGIAGNELEKSDQKYKSGNEKLEASPKEFSLDDKYYIDKILKLRALENLTERQEKQLERYKNSLSAKGKKLFKELYQ